VQLNGVSYKLVHGAPVENFNFDPKYQNAVHFAVWKRLEASDPPPEDYTLIFGHTPTRYYQDCIPMEVWYSHNRIGIDCGSGYPEDPDEPLSALGRLACLRLDDGMVFYSQE
jgi:serine/threonine protein phosphatase 1